LNMSDMFSYAARTAVGPCPSSSSAVAALVFGTNFVLFLILRASSYYLRTGNSLMSMAHAFGLAWLMEHKDIKEGDGEVATQAKKLSTPLEATQESILELSTLLAQVGGLMAITFIFEFYPPFPHSPKVKSLDLFWAWTFIFVLYGFTGVKEQKDTNILGRSQTEEWKGWMQWMFLLYHYYAAAETYNSIRVMITCYVWMTGFGNFSFFYIKEDFGLVRVLQMLFRLNFLVLCLMLTLGNTYLLYYICPLHTFFFFLVYITMYIRSDLNHSQHGIRLKLFCVGVAIFVIWDLNPTCLWPWTGFGLLPTNAIIGATNGAQWEWYFRSSLDHWSTFLGMIFALNFPAATQWLTVVEGLPQRRQLLVKCTSAFLLVCPFAWWASTVFPENKLNYNLTNPYFSPLFPLLAYIFLRNISPWMRARFLGPLEIVGKTTLETYLLQHHWWLTSNAKSLLTLIPGYPILNFALVTVVYFFAAKKLYALTLSIRGMLLPDDLQSCLRNLMGVVVVLGVGFGAAGALNGMQAPSLTVLAAGCCIFAVITVLVLAHALPQVSPEAAGAMAPVAVLLQFFCVFGVLVLAAASLIQSHVEGQITKVGNCGPTEFAAPKPICSMGNPMLGCLVLALSAVMLLTRDNYLGLPSAVLYLFENKVISWSEAYIPFHEKTGIARKPDQEPTAL